jgi:hypothetical protein
VTLTVWRLRDPARQETRCLLIHHEDTDCELRVERARVVITVEQQLSVDAAFNRANALWVEYLLEGWTEL